MAKYFRTKYQIKNSNPNHVGFEIKEVDSHWYGFIVDPFDTRAVTQPLNYDGADTWLGKVATSIEAGGDTVTVIDDF